MFRFLPICTLANLFNRWIGGKPQVFHAQQLPPDNLQAEERGGSRRGGLMVGWEKKAPGTKLSHSGQVLGHGFVLATITKQQTTSVGKGHKKFSFPLLKPSGAYKKKTTQLVGWDGW